MRKVRLRLRRSFAGDLHLDGHEMRVLDADADLFHRRDQIGLSVLILAQHGREQPDELLAADRRAHVEPCAVRLYFHVEIAAEFRIPPLDRRDSALPGRRTALRIGMGACDQGFQPAGGPGIPHGFLRRVFLPSGVLFIIRLGYSCANRPKAMK